jgi:HEPN domain-containing protein
VVIDWEDFKKQSESDIAACKLLYYAGDYGNAAYHMQQAVEKHVKAILLHGKLMPKHKTHLPLSESLIEEFIQGLDDFQAVAERYNVKVFEPEDSVNRTQQFLIENKAMMRALAEKRKSFKCALWKNSIGVPLIDSQEEAVFQQCSMFRKYYKLKMTIVLLSVGAGAKRNLMKDPKIKKLDYYKPIVELGRMIAATFPHEEIGRYPTEIRTPKGVENSVELYKNHKDKLLKLINTAEKYLTEG